MQYPLDRKILKAEFFDQKNYISKPWIDAVFFLFTPWIAYGLGALVFLLGLAPWVTATHINAEVRVEDLGGIFVSAHLFAVFFRSHGNPEIFRLFPARFIAVPILLLGSMLWSPMVMVCVSVLATWWDVYHSSLQTFGLGRIYDAKKGNPGALGRRQDIIMNLFMYAGPILAGASLVDHINSFQEFNRIGSALFSNVPAFALTNQRFATYAIVGLGVPYSIYYFFYYQGLARKGYQISLQKCILYLVTGLTSIFAWGFNSFGEAFFVMNFFHALQYFALIWLVEEKSITRVFKIPVGLNQRLRAFVLFGLVIFVYGVSDLFLPKKYLWFYCVSLTVSILHFWYDGFIWSVRKKQVFN